VWPRVRAAAISVLLTLGFISGWPKISPGLLAHLPDGVARTAAQIPTLQAELLQPFTPLASAFGIYSQNWGLFAATGGIRHRMWVEGQAAGTDTWVLLHRAHDDEHAYLRATLEHRRVRLIWNPHRWGTVDGYPAFGRWLARRVLLDFPRFERVRLRMERIELLDKGRGFRATGQFEHELSHSRSELLP
jgi:hypothetical protein